jgi:FixJ family two-component response regulator
MTTTRDTPGFPSTVLVVDDEPSIVQLLTEMFNVKGIDVVARGSGEEALEVLEQDRIGCLLVDKNLPGIDGLEVVRAAKRLQPYCACIVMTAYSSTASAVEALRLGAADYLEKPFEDIALIAEKVSRAVAHKQALMERDALLARIREYAAQLDEKDAEVGKRRTEVEMLEMVLEARIREATDDLRRKSKILKTSLEEARAQNARMLEIALTLQHEVDALEVDAHTKNRLTDLVSALKSPPDAPPT